MEAKLFSGQSKRKIKVFSLFLACSFLAWFLSNLSDSYESRANFVLNYRNLPDSLLLGNNPVNSIEAKIRTNGFRMFYFNLVKKRMNLDVSQVVYADGKYTLSEDAVKKQLEGQFSQSVSLLDLDRNRLEVDLYQVASKKIPVRPNIELKFESNHLLNGIFTIEPDSILVKGPAREIDTLMKVETEPIVLNDISSDFSVDAALVFPNALENSIFSKSRVKVSGKVARFSEKEFEVPIRAINFPEGYEVKLFPNKISLVCKASIANLKDISSEDFQIIADYKQLGGASNNSLLLRIVQSPEDIYGVRLQERTVNFVLERK
ncbi:YbbR-like domain-containing protein [Flagellimonas allohymeniacidonis]|uniref:YbbR-like domain-containing protein n=1 Tax=Flagellimonas allohymeniacidonis TaxID=2517819 RepID=A0A4Q8QEY5_9FLAO|nr:YbbR-like domain-containing protein [Allomuricauda hymeniacidonis]TAI49062.1 YbbR-like domain-containing protein [Allomuricauda hymeniacidonis]